MVSFKRDSMGDTGMKELVDTSGHTIGSFTSVSVHVSSLIQVKDASRICIISPP